MDESIKIMPYKFSMPKEYSAQIKFFLIPFFLFASCSNILSK
jgi:hypothetical protein